MNRRRLKLSRVGCKRCPDHGGRARTERRPHFAPPPTHTRQAFRGLDLLTIHAGDIEQAFGSLLTSEPGLGFVCHGVRLIGVQPLERVSLATPAADSVDEKPKPGPRDHPDRSVQPVHNLGAHAARDGVLGGQLGGPAGSEPETFPLLNHSAG
jgi:hypothetical protein